MKFNISKGPHIRTDNKTEKMMKHLLIALFPIIIFAYVKNGLMPYLDNQINFITSLKPLFMVIVAMLTGFITEMLWAKFVLKKEKKQIKYFMKNSYSLIPGLLLALILPINIPFYVLIMGSLFATIFGKLIFGGFGYNIFNPALTGRLFIIGSYFTVITNNGGYLNATEVDTISGATPLTNMSTNMLGSFEQLVEPFGNLWNFFIGFVPGSLGETSALLCILGLIYLLIKKVISWRIPIIYIGTVFILTYIIGINNGLGLWYPSFHILSGGLMFGAIFMATDPVTSPTTNTGQILYGIGLGFLTVLFRFLTSYPEGVLTAILTMNLLVIIIDKLCAKGKFNKKKLIIPFVILISIITITTIYISKSKEEPIIDSNFEVIEVNNDIYMVSGKGFHGLIEANITIHNNKVTNVEITSQHENVWKNIETNDYINQIIDNQSNLDELDTISGATYTSNYLKDIIQKTLDYHRSDN